MFVACYIYSVNAPKAFCLTDSTSFDPQPVVVRAANTAVPVGTVIVWTREEIPDGWLECNGQAVNENLYPDLFALMSKTPNYQGMFLRGAGSQTLEHGEYGSVTHGTQLGEVQGDTIRERTTSEEKPYMWIANGFGGNLKLRGGWLNGPDGGKGLYNTFYLPEIHDGPTSQENRPVNIGVKYIIKAE